jgi:paraquat-inducible protein B
LVGPDAPANQELREALQEIAGAARALKVFVEYMDSHPEAFIRGKTQEKP